MTIFQILFVLSALGCYVVVLSDQVLIATAGYALQDYLCSEPLESNTTVMLDDGEHRVSSGPPCNIPDGDSITITGSSMINTTVRCEEEGTVFAFISAQKLTIERITFINCGIKLVSIENILITECKFQSSSNAAIFSESNNKSSITMAYSSFINNGNGGAVYLRLSNGDVSITNCTFHSNSYNNSGGAMSLSISTGSVSITKTTANSGYGGGAVSLSILTGDISINNCTFQKNSASYDDGGGGGGVFLKLSTGEVSITNSTFQNNWVNYGDNDGDSGGGIYLRLSTGGLASLTALFKATGVQKVVVVWLSMTQKAMLASQTAHFRITMLLMGLLVVAE